MHQKKLWNIIKEFIVHIAVILISKRMAKVPMVHNVGIVNRVRNTFGYLTVTMPATSLECILKRFTIKLVHMEITNLDYL